MSAMPLPGDARAQRRRRALWLLWVALPLATLGSQIATKLVASALIGAPLTWSLAWRVASLPAAWAVAIFELVSLGFWMLILTEISLSAAFSISALSYVLVVGSSWTVFHEAVGALQIVGGAAILTGVWLIGRTPSEE